MSASPINNTRFGEMFSAIAARGNLTPDDIASLRRMAASIYFTYILSVIIVASRGQSLDERKAECSDALERFLEFLTLIGAPGLMDSQENAEKTHRMFHTAIADFRDAAISPKG